MKWVTREVPPKVKGTNAWNLLIPQDLLRMMRSHPGTTFQLTNDDGTPLRMSWRRYLALHKACPRPFRLQSRSLTGRKEDDRQVWVSLDPAYWEHQKHLREKK